MAARRAQYLEVRGSVHRKLLAKLNLEKLATAERKSVEAEIRGLVSALIAEAGVPLSVTAGASGLIICLVNRSNRAARSE